MVLYLSSSLLLSCRQSIVLTSEFDSFPSNHIIDNQNALLYLPATTTSTQNMSAETPEAETPTKESAPATDKTPEKVEKIPKDDSLIFKTCKTTMATPATRRQLRMTPARISLSEGKKVFREANSSGKKFNSRKKLNNSSKNIVEPARLDSLIEQNNNINNTAGSNETFIRCEQELMFDRDSLEFASNNRRISSSPKHVRRHQQQLSQQKQQQQQKMRTSSPKKAATLPSPIVSKARISKSPIKKASPAKANKIQLSPIQNKMPPPVGVPKQQKPAPKLNEKSLWNSSNRSKFVTPQATKPAAVFRVPSSLKGTASKYLNSSQWNNSRLTRAQSFKSTAEIERNYFSSLRSFR